MLGFTGTFEGRADQRAVDRDGMPERGDRVRGALHARGDAAGPGRHVRRHPAGLCMADTVVAHRRVGRRPDAVAVRQMDGFAPSGDVRARRARRARWVATAGEAVHVGPVVTRRHLLRPRHRNVTRWRRLGHLGVEMEAAMLYTVAAVNGIEALAMMTVSDILGATSRRADQRRRAARRRRRDDPRRLPCRRVMITSSKPTVGNCSRRGRRPSIVMNTIPLLLAAPLLACSARAAATLRRPTPAPQPQHRRPACPHPTSTSTAGRSCRRPRGRPRSRGGFGDPPDVPGRLGEHQRRLQHARRELHPRGRHAAAHPPWPRPRWRATPR